MAETNQTNVEQDVVEFWNSPQGKSFRALLYGAVSLVISYLATAIVHANPGYAAILAPVVNYILVYVKALLDGDGSTGSPLPAQNIVPANVPIVPAAAK